MLTCTEVALNDSDEPGVREIPRPAAIHHRGETGDAHSDQETPRLQNAIGLLEGHSTVRFVQKMVERTHEQYDIGGRSRKSETPSVPGQDLYRGRTSRSLRSLPRLADVEWDRVHKMDFVTELGKPTSVGPWASADVVDDSAPSRQVPADELLGSHELQLSADRSEPGLLVRDSRVMSDDLGENRWRSRPHSPQRASQAHMRSERGPNRGKPAAGGICTRGSNWCSEARPNRYNSASCVRIPSLSSLSGDPLLPLQGGKPFESAEDRLSITFEPRERDGSSEGLSLSTGWTGAAARRSERDGRG
jgi:hypothetical protein